MHNRPLVRSAAHLAGAAFLLLTLASCSSRPPAVTVSGNSPYGQEGLHVNGTAIVRAQPDLATVSLGLVRSGSRARAVKDSSDAVMRQVIAAIRAQGVAENDIQTVEYSLTTGPIDYGPRRGQMQWSLRNTLQVRVRKVGTVADVVDAATEAGANYVSSVTYSVESIHKLRAQAREQAIQVAKDKAEQLAKLTGATIDRVVAIHDGAYSDYGPWNYRYSNVNAQSVANSPQAQQNTGAESEIASGQVAVQAYEEVVFALR